MTGNLILHGCNVRGDPSRGRMHFGRGGLQVFVEIHRLVQVIVMRIKGYRWRTNHERDDLSFCDNLCFW